MRITNWLRIALAPLVAVALLSFASAALADEPGEEAMAEPTQEALEQEEGVRGPPGIEEITVTARKRTENLQQTPISITAFNPNDLQDIQARRIDDIGRAVPNLQIEQSYNSSYINIRIRGIGNSDPIVTRDPSVGLYMDGVYVARAYGALLSVSDLSNVEVLRGP